MTMVDEAKPSEADPDSVELLALWRAGDEQAAETLFRRYVDRLVLLARGRMSTKMTRRVDAEDVVQSAYRSFFVGARAGRYELQRGGDLWRLLVAITLNKVLHQVRRNRASKRAVDRERNFASAGALGVIPAEFLAREPSPEEGAVLADEVEHVLQELTPRQRGVLELRLQGYNLDEIADTTRLSVRTVRRVLEHVKQLFEERHAASSEDA